MIQRYIPKTKIFTLQDKVTIRTRIKGYTFRNDYLELSETGMLIIQKGYSWNGCSPKFALYDMIFGTPEGAVSPLTNKQKTYYASLIHDAFYQISESIFDIKEHKRERKMADRVFLDILRWERFKPRQIYYLVVRVFGYFCWGKIPSSQ